MNALLLNRDGFQMPEDGWYQLAPLGEFAHAQAGVVQVVDREACEGMVKRFNEEAGREPFDKLRAERFAGVLVDFDHFSLDGEKRSEAAGWITELEARDEVSGVGCQVSGGENGRLRNGGSDGPASSPAETTPRQSPAGAGLWAKIRWSDLGEEAVKGGRYRFLSPVWARKDCVDLGPDPQSGRDRVRPVRLLNAAVTNDPNLKGMRPLSNRSQESEDRSQNGGEEFTTKHTKTTRGREEFLPQMDTDTRRFLKNAKEAKGPPSPGGSGATAPAAPASGQRFKWVLGRTESGKHCPSCAAVAGQVHTMAEWEAAGMTPGGGALYCQGNCRCRLVGTNESARGDLAGGPVRRRKAEMENRARRARLTMERLEGRMSVASGQLAVAGNRRRAKEEGVLHRVMANIGWTDEARIAALAVRKAKAGLRGKVEKKKRQDEAEKPPDVFAGGTPFFDERTGKYVYPPEMWVPPGGVPGLPGGRVPVAGVVPKGRPRLKHPYVPPGYKGWM
jgi:hypothetical protein